MTDLPGLEEAGDAFQEKDLLNTWSLLAKPVKAFDEWSSKLSSINQVLMLAVIRFFGLSLSPNVI